MYGSKTVLKRQKNKTNLNGGRVKVVVRPA